MDEIIRRAPSGNSFPDGSYERSEDVSVKMKTCDSCEGSGKIYYCSECDVNIQLCKCGDGQIIQSERCEDCIGEGEVESW